MLYPAMVCYGKLRFFQNVQKISKVPLYKYRKKDQENGILMKNNLKTTTTGVTGEFKIYS